MKCEQCRWFVVNINDHYGICKRYPTNQNKTKADFCGEFTYIPMEVATEPKIQINFVEPMEYDINTDQVVPKRGRKPKNVD